jgi:hypothetical protein
MAGGNWTTQNKVLPGVYTNVRGEATAGISAGDRGIVALPLILPWLTPKTVLTITKDTADAILAVLGTAGLLIREAIKKASVVLLYRLNEGTAATATAGNLTATAKYPGTLGNELKISVEAVAGESGQFYVRTFRGTAEVDIQKAAEVAGLSANAYITLSGTGVLTASAGVSLTGGADGSVVTADYSAALAAFELYTFHAVSCPVTTTDVIALFTAYAQRLRTEEGKNIQAVVPDTLSVNSYAVLSVKNGYTLADGTVLTAAQATAFVAGATAGVPLTESLTNAIVPGAVDVATRYTNTQLTANINAGQIVFIPGPYGSNEVRICADINTLITFTEERPKAFSKNKIIRTLDTIDNHIQERGNAAYVGKISNLSDGRALFKAEIFAYFVELEEQGILSDVSADDIVISKGDASDAVVVTYGARPIDVMEKLYNTIVVSAAV